MQVSRTPIGLRYFAPSPALRGVVSSFYVFHADLVHCSDSMRADLPQVRFMIQGGCTYTLPDGKVQVAPDVGVIGPTFGSTYFQGHGPLIVFGVGLLPAGWASLIREDASQFCDTMVDARLLLDETITDALHVLRRETTQKGMVAAADTYFRNLFASADEPPLWFTTIMNRWLASALSPQVDDLIAASGLSSRQVERLTKRIYGASPKMLARKYRALKAASALADSRTSWQEVAGEAFFDQSHFIREFKQFIGTTPKQLLLNPSPLTRLTFQRRKLTDTLPELTLIT